MKYRKGDIVKIKDMELAKKLSRITDISLLDSAEGTITLTPKYDPDLDNDECEVSFLDADNVTIRFRLKEDEIEPVSNSRRNIWMLADVAITNVDEIYRKRYADVNFDGAIKRATVIDIDEKNNLCQLMVLQYESSYNIELPISSVDIDNFDQKTAIGKDNIGDYVYVAPSALFGRTVVNDYKNKLHTKYIGQIIGFDDEDPDTAIVFLGGKIQKFHCNVLGLVDQLARLFTVIDIEYYYDEYFARDYYEYILRKISIRIGEDIEWHLLNKEE